MRQKVMRAKIARGLRKWADLLDPRVGPSGDFTIRVDCDASGAIETLTQLSAAMDEWRREFTAHGT